jgi:Holliday junction resolvase
MTEQQIQTKIINTLRKGGWYVNKLINTSHKGIPDLICHKDGRTVYIEVKRPGQKPRVLQEFRMKELLSYGIPSLTLTTEIECLQKLQSIIYPKD